MSTTTDKLSAAVSTGADNTIPIEAWNTVLFEKYCRFRYVLTHGLAGHSEELLRRRPYTAGVRVLDIGCGFGDTTQLISRQVSPAGAAIGVDCASNFIDVASREAREAGASSIEFLIADVQTDDLRGPYDHAFSRFGTMFFNLPVARSPQCARNPRYESALHA
jgi:2-polyprenyl-3-methyl-5-hydroxy-6-metoxy-1,4-benzoquinol methylase